MKRFLPFVALCAILCEGAAPLPDSTLTVRVGNVRNATGLVHIDVCPEASFLKENCPYSASVPARPGIITIVAHRIPAGHYAIQAFQDENGNHKVDRALFGIPKEGVGFSNDAPIRLGPPKWADAVFAFNGAAQTVEFKLRYFLGPSGPQTH